MAVPLSESAKRFSAVRHVVSAAGLDTWSTLRLVFVDYLGLCLAGRSLAGFSCLDARSSAVVDGSLLCDRGGWITPIVARPRWRGAPAGVLSVWLIIGMSPLAIGTHGHGPRWLAGWIGELPVLSSHEASEKDFRATFIDVGHGTSVMLELPGGEILLYDAGHLGSPDRSHQEIASVLGTCALRVAKVVYFARRC